MPAFADTPPADEMEIHSFEGLRFVVAGRDRTHSSRLLVFDLTLFQYSLIPLFPLNGYSSA